MKKIELILKKVGLSEVYKSDNFYSKKIILRDGREAILWVNYEDGHGILDDEFWEDQNFYRKDYRDEFSSSLVSQTKSEEHLEVYKKINEKQFNQFKNEINHETSFLEIGSSFGGISKFIDKLELTKKDFIEPNEDDYSFCKERFQKCNFFNYNFESFNFEKNKYDMIVSFEVLEHIFDLSLFLKKLNSILNQNGSVNFEVPNHKDALLVNYKNIGYSNFYYHKAHVHYFTPESLKNIFFHFGIDGEVFGFQMYPLFNQINWLYNNLPQKTAVDALNIPEFDTDNSNNILLNTFFQKIHDEYYNLVEKNLISDCLIFKGKKI
jgi:hypothetical protein